MTSSRRGGLDMKEMAVKKMKFIKTGLSVLGLSFCGLLSHAAHAEDYVLNLSVQNSQPKYILQDDGGITGLCGEIYTALKRKLSVDGVAVSIADHTRPIKRILTDLRTGKSDMFCGAGRNAQREVEFIYSVRPVYHTSNVLVTHENNPFYPKNFTDLKNSKVEVGAFLGTTSAEYLKLQTGVRVNDNFTSLDEALDRVADDEKFRLFYYHDLGLVYLIEKRKLPLRIIPTKFRTVPQWLLYSRMTNKALVAKVEDAMLQMEVSGELADIQSRYTTSDTP